MNIENLKKLISENGGERVYIKELAENDNSKNQVYFGSSFDILNIFPIESVYSDYSGGWKRHRFKTSLSFYWITEEGKLEKAPHSQFILYPKYPEVRFSGFLNNCDNPPDLMRHRIKGRMLFLSVNKEGDIIGYVAGPDSEVAQEIQKFENISEHGVFKVIELLNVNNKDELLETIKEIHNKGWIDSKRLNKNGEIQPCNAPQCGGYTLEAELGITPNSFSEPDFLGWEIKQFTVPEFQKFDKKAITLMTPEPTGGFYKEYGAEEFVRKYGYPDQLGRRDRLNFGGIHRVGDKHKRTNLTLTIKGFDSNENKITDINGRIALEDSEGYETATWSFESFIKHWNRKHNLACYIPTLAQMQPKQYYFGNNVILGINTDFILFLKSFAMGNIYYDPGIKVEEASGNSKTKRRSQFRIKSGDVCSLYNYCEIYE